MVASLDDLGERRQLFLAGDSELEGAGGEAQVEEGPQGMGHAGHHTDHA
jgi:hypothetical protein